VTQTGRRESFPFLRICRFFGVFQGVLAGRALLSLKGK